MKRLATMLQATQAGTWEWNVQTGECHFNERWAEIIGYSLSELEPISIETWQTLVHPEDGEVSDQILQQHFDGKRDFYECEARIRHKDERWVWVRDYGKLVSRTAHGEPEWVVGTHIDITALVELSQRFEVFADLLPGVVYQFELAADGTSRFPFASKGLQDIYGVKPEQVKLSATAVFEALHRDDFDRVRTSIEKSAETGDDWVCEYRVQHSGLERWVFGHARPQTSIEGSTLWYGMIIDITERKKLELELERSQANLKLAQKIAKTGHWKANIKTGELYWSDIVYQILGYNRDSVTPSTEFFRSLVPEEELSVVLESEAKAVITGTHDVEHRMKTASGDFIWVHELAELQRDKVTLVGTVQDITEQKELELKLQRQAVIDPLTQVYNRRYFSQALDTEFHRKQRYKDPLSLITFDLDHFKQVNDNYGHGVGDKVLIEVTKAVSRQLRATDVFARVGGEEFAILLPKTTFEEAKKVAEKLRQAVQQLVVENDDDPVKVTSTFGVVAMNEQIETEEHLQQIADRALYRGKQTGRNCVYPADQSLY
ncbi:MAG: diguanylate cyclase [Pseudomonadota bacterium]